MKNIVITGSARGLGLEMAKVFVKNNNNVVISDINEDNLKKSLELLKKLNDKVNVYSFKCDITKEDEVIKLIDFAYSKLSKVDIWVNNAGVNQPDKNIWELELAQIEMVLNVDLKGTIICSKNLIPKMIKTGGGAIYNVEGYGSNDAMMPGLSIYGTSKRAITYFSDALAKECEEAKTNIIVGKLSPGIMITDFIQNALNDKEKINLPEKTKKVYNILGDYPDVVAKYLVDNMLTNTKNAKRIMWLTNKKAFWRFLTAGFNKRDFFK